MSLRDKVIHAVNKACLEATAEKLADAVMEVLEEKDTKAKAILDVMVQLSDDKEFMEKVFHMQPVPEKEVTVCTKTTVCKECGVKSIMPVPEKPLPEWEKRFDAYLDEGCLIDADSVMGDEMRAFIREEFKKMGDELLDAPDHGHRIEDYHVSEALKKRGV